MRDFGMQIDIDCPIYEGTNNEKEDFERAIDIFSNNREKYMLSFNYPNINSDTVSFLLYGVNYSKIYNNNPIILKLAFYLYQGINGISFDYRKLNDILRKNNGQVTNHILSVTEFEESDDMDYDLPPTIRHYKLPIKDEIYALDYLIESQPQIKDDIIVQRKTSLREVFGNMDLSNVHSIDSLIGKTYKCDSYVSTSYGVPHGLGIDGKSVHLFINVPSGTHILGPFSGYGEREILLGRGYTFKIVKIEEYVNGSNKEYRIYVELIKREKELTLKPMSEITMPKELIEMSKKYNLNVDSTDYVQQDIIDSEIARKKQFFFDNSLSDDEVELLSCLENIIGKDSLEFKNLIFRFMLTSNKENRSKLISNIILLINKYNNQKNVVVKKN